MKSISKGLFCLPTRCWRRRPGLEPGNERSSAFERSGPERFLSSIQLIADLIDVARQADGRLERSVIGRLTASLLVLRRLSRGVAAMLEAGENPSNHAAIVKDLGAVFEQSVPEIAQTLADAEPALNSSMAYQAVLANVMLNAPSWSLRGGTREILRELSRAALVCANHGLNKSSGVHCGPFT
jgi:hypothetical protein